MSTGTSMQPFATDDARLVRMVDSALPGAKIVVIRALGTDLAGQGSTSKATGYGAPLAIDVDQAGVLHRLVLHTATANEFGHDRRADRAADVLLAADTFQTVPRQVKALDVGAFRADGFVSLKGTGEFYLLTEWGEGEVYAESLRRIARTGRLEPADLDRVDAMAAYLSTLHRERLETPFARTRALRDLLGSGEGIFGIVDGYPQAVPGVPQARLRRIEERCLEWRWRLKKLERPLVRTHGDFHPFNVLFDPDGQLVLLDTSRGAMGDAADDLTCMALNYPFFALEHAGSWQGAFSVLWNRLWERYLELSGDAGLLAVAPPFLAWRALVLASPLWYPGLTADSRARLLDFVDRVLASERFSPELVAGMFS